MKKILAGLFMAVLLVAFVTGCSSGGGDTAPATALGYVILAESGISSASESADVTGNMGLSPAAASFITGFSLVADASTEFSTSAQVTGNIYAADYATPTPANLTSAVADMHTMYTALAGMASDGALVGELGGETINPGVWTIAGGVGLTAGNLTLSGSGEYVFQIGGALTTAASTGVVLASGAVPENIKWVVAGGVTLGAASTFKGVILSQTAIGVGATAAVDGRLLAQTAVTLGDGSIVTAP